MNKKTLMFIGSKKLGLDVLLKMYEVLHDEYKIVCATIDDSQDVRSYYARFKEITQEFSIKLYTISKEYTLKNVISVENPIMCFVVGWYSIIDESVLKLVPNGFIGIHNSLLPKYRGFAPLVWQLINGEKSIGYSVFSFDKGMDTGRIWYQEEIQIGDNKYIGEVLDIVEEHINRSIGKILLGIINNEIVPQEQQLINISYGAKRTPYDGKINWNKKAIHVYDFIRAQSKPYPGAYSFFGETKIIIWKACVFKEYVYGHPGQIFQLDSEFLIICGDNTAIVLEEYDVLKETVIINDFKFSLNTVFGEN